ncbi:MAG: mannose-6-phosphate isomerase, class I [Acidimicrobiales bacterium]
MYRLHNTIQRYDWGSTTLLPRLLGIPPDGTPQAELWMGAHPAAPSHVQLADRRVSLAALLASDPQRHLGAAVTARFGPQLPFLLKVLAAARPLSLQLHPDGDAARAGFALEEAAGLDANDPARTYRDPNPKPEVLCALDRFEALSGFRAPPATAELLEAFALDRPWVELARRADAGRLCGALWDLPVAEQAGLADQVTAAAAAGGAAAARFPREAAFVRSAAAHHPHDVGLVVGLCLNRLRLLAGQALYAPANRLHAYLEGIGVELMANSDNVVRAGLTTKAVNVAELRRLLEVEPVQPRALEAETDPVTGEARYRTPAEEFALSRFLLEGDRVAVRSPGPEILLCTDGGADLVELPGAGAGAGAGAVALALDRGDSVFVPAATAGYRLRGVGTVYRAQVGFLAA